MIEPTVIEALEADEAEENPLAYRPKVRERMEFALPTINVIFLLMLYFLVAGTIIQQNELSITPPETERVPTERLPRPLLLIDNSGVIFLDGVEVSRDDLVPAVVARVASITGAAAQLNILAPADMSATPFLQLLTALDAANVPLRVVTIPEAETAAGSGGG
jgi:biopolymer transport protein ExbD